MDQLSVQAPFLPVAFFNGQAGCLGSFFSAYPLPGCPNPNPNPNALPDAGVIDPNFIPCLALFQGFPGGDRNRPNFGNPSQADVENPATFAKITSTVGTPRLIQFSLRWAF